MADPEGRTERWASARARDAACVAMLGGLALAAWYLRILRPAHIPFEAVANGDLFLHVVPVWHRTVAFWREGELPLWNPYQLAGQPLLASVYGALYPPNAVYGVFSAPRAIELLTVFHLSVAGVSTYAYLRTIRLSRSAACLGGVVFASSGFLASQAVWFPPALAAAVWLPLALLALERLFTHADALSAGLLAAAVALCFLAGWPQTWLFSMYVVTAYGAARFAAAAADPGERRHLLRASVLTGGALLLALAWMAPQLLPSLELQALGPRRVGALSAGQRSIFGLPTTPSVLLAETLDGAPGPARWSYVGSGVLLLLPLACAAARRQGWRVVCFGLLAALSCGIAISPIGSPLSALHDRLGGAVFRAPLRILYVFAVAVAMLAAIGFDALVRRASAPRPGGNGLRSALGAWRGPGLASALLLAALLVPAPPRAAAYLVASFAGIATALGSRRAALRRAALCGLAGLIALDLLTASENAHLRPIQRSQAFDAHRGAIEFIRMRQGLDRTYVMASQQTPELMAKLGSLHGLYSITDYEPLSLSRWDRFFRALESPRERRPEVFAFTGALQASPARSQFALLDLLSVRYVLGAEHQHALQALAPKWRRALQEEGGVAIWENADPLPRAYLVQHAVPAASEDEALLRVLDPGFDPRRSVVLETSAPDAAGGALAPIRPASVTRHAPRRVVIEVDAPAGGWLVLTDTHYPGWWATVDGRRASIACANFLFRAVRVPPGAHRVEFAYQPRSFRIGAAAAGWGTGAAAFAWLADRLHRRRQLRKAARS